MDGLTFTDHLIGHLAWPLAVSGLIAFLSLRHRTAINNLIDRLHKAKAGLFEIELAELQASAERAQLPPPPVLTPPSTPKTPTDPQTGQQRPEADADVPEELYELIRVAIEDPRRAVIDTYHFVNRYAWEASRELDPEQVRYTDGSPAVMRAAAVQLLAPKHADVLDRLRDAALSALDPDQEIMPGQAIDYVIQASRLVGFMKGRVDGRKAARASRPPGGS